MDWWKKFLWPINQWLDKTVWWSQKVSTGQGDDYITGCLQDYACFKDN